MELLARQANMAGMWQRERGMFGWLKDQVTQMAGWRNMDTAPRDGTEIEIKCTYGYKPSFMKARWTNDKYAGPIWQSTQRLEYTNLVTGEKGSSPGCFVEDVDSGSNGANNSNLRWRPI